MTLSEIRRAIDALKRKFATELTIIKLRRVAQAVSNDWDPDQPPEPHDVIQRFVKAGSLLPTFANLARYLNKTRRQGDVPDPVDMVVNLLPWIDASRYSDLLDWDLPAQPSSPSLLPF